jgi:hypothetical protein
VLKHYKRKDDPDSMDHGVMKMTVSLTAEEVIDRGLWEEVCDMKGFSVWCVNEGQMDSDEIITFTEEEAKTLRLI